ncbi:MAG: hypothetical protein IJF76_03655 [Clostridia bacterium]|nr:hypothetical protein [Clostridia bacterium]
MENSKFVVNDCYRKISQLILEGKAIEAFDYAKSAWDKFGDDAKGAVLYVSIAAVQNNCSVKDAMALFNKYDKINRDGLFTYGIKELFEHAKNKAFINGGEDCSPVERDEFVYEFVKWCIKYEAIDSGVELLEVYCAKYVPSNKIKYLLAECYDNESYGHYQPYEAESMMKALAEEGYLPAVEYCKKYEDDNLTEIDNEESSSESYDSDETEDILENNDSDYDFLENSDSAEIDEEDFSDNAIEESVLRVNVQDEVERVETKKEKLNCSTARLVIKTWKKGSAVAKVESAWTTLLTTISLLVWTAVLYSMLAVRHDWPPIINFENLFAGKTDAEIFELIMTDGMQYITLFFLITSGGMFITKLFYMFSTFNLARWMDQKSANYKKIILHAFDDKNERRFAERLAHGYIVSQRSQEKKRFVIDLLLYAILGAVYMYLSLNFIVAMAEGLYVGIELERNSAGEVFGTILTSMPAIIWYVSCVVFVAYNIYFKRSTKAKLAKV